MKSLVVGLGVQGQKRRKALQSHYVGSVDPVNTEADFTHIEQVPLDRYDSVFCCVPDISKYQVIDYCAKHSKHLLLEKPLIAETTDKLHLLEKLYNKNHLYLQTAYNHRFEPNIVRIKTLLDQNSIGRIYTVRIFYGNGTSALIAQSPWRNSGYGVGVDLGSHILDMLHYWFGCLIFTSHSLKQNYETNCDDFFAFIGVAQDSLLVSFQASYLSWKNTFHCEISGSLGTIFMDSFCKWSDSILELRTRVFPSGIPSAQTFNEPYGDLTWVKEQETFFSNINKHTRTDLTKDRYIQQTFKNIGLI